MNQTYPFSLVPLPYAYDALEPFIDEETLHFHHDKHLQTYVDNLNKTLEGYPEYHKMDLETLIKEIPNMPVSIQDAVRNNGGGVYNHNLYFSIMGPAKSNGEPVGEIKTEIEKTFGSVQEFLEIFKTNGLGQFGSGYAWLVTNEENQLGITTTPNQNCVLEIGLKPLMLMDVWEHAYYLKRQNRRAEYIDNFFKVINWEQVNKNYTK